MPHASVQDLTPQVVPYAARPEQAEPFYEAFCAALEAEGIEVARGRFGAKMLVEIANDGPVTIVLESG